MAYDRSQLALPDVQMQMNAKLAKLRILSRHVEQSSRVHVLNGSIVEILEEVFQGTQNGEAALGV